MVDGKVTAKPFLRWAGSKRKQVSRLREFWSPTYRRYIEPFAGSSCLFFALQPERAILSDNNQELIDTYHSVQQSPEEIYDAVLRIPRTKAKYEQMRAESPTNLRRVQRAVRFIFLNRNCFNGIYRTNLHGKFNVPFA